MYKCKICKKNFSDLFEHLDTAKEGFLEIKDKKHREYFKKIENAGYDDGGYCDVDCFCGGKIRMTSVGYDGWETTCEECGFLYDED